MQTWVLSEATQRLICQCHMKCCLNNVSQRFKQQYFEINQCQLMARPGLYLKCSVTNCKNSCARCVAYISGQILTRGLDSFMITLRCNKMTPNTLLIFDISIWCCWNCTERIIFRINYNCFCCSLDLLNNCFASGKINFELTLVMMVE